MYNIFLSDKYHSTYHAQIVLSLNNHLQWRTLLIRKVFIITLLEKMADKTAGTASTYSRTTRDSIASPVDTPNFIDNEFVTSRATEWILVHDPV